VNFAKGLANSTVFAPLLSASCLKNFVELGQEDKEDFVLAEWIMALELEKQGIVKAIFPIVMGEQGKDGKYSETFFESLRNGRVSWSASDGSHDAGSGVIPDVVSAKSNAKAREFLGMLDPPVELSEELTVDAVVKKVLKFQAILLHFDNDAISSADGMQQLVRVDSAHGTRAKATARSFVAQKCAERILKVVKREKGADWWREAQQQHVPSSSVSSSRQLAADSGRPHRNAILLRSESEPTEGSSSMLDDAVEGQAVPSQPTAGVMTTKGVGLWPRWPPPTFDAVYAVA
jgi:hypothetical protein